MKKTHLDSFSTWALRLYACMYVCRKASAYV